MIIRSLTACGIIPSRIFRVLVGLRDEIATIPEWFEVSIRSNLSNALLFLLDTCVNAPLFSNKPSFLASRDLP